MKDDEARMKEDESSCSMYGDEGDDDDDFDDTPRSKRAGKKVDEDYEPPSSATIKKAQGRSSSRTIVSTFGFFVSISLKNRFFKIIQFFARTPLLLLCTQALSPFSCSFSGPSAIMINTSRHFFTLTSHYFQH